MFCENCGNMMSDNAKFCGKCGQRVKERKTVCPKCGAEFEAGQIYCEQCGSRLSAETVEAVPNVPIEDPVEDPISDPSKGNAVDLDNFELTGSKIEEIKRLRAITGMSLKEAKETIDRMYAEREKAGSNPDPHPEPQPKSQDTYTCLAQSPTVSYYKGDKALGSSSTNGVLKMYADRIEFATTFSAGFLLGSSAPKVLYFRDISGVSRGRYMMGASILIVCKNGEKHTFASLSSNLYTFLDKVLAQMR